MTTPHQRHGIACEQCMHTETEYTDWPCRECLRMIACYCEQRVDVQAEFGFMSTATADGALGG
jgi:hypothetical protein